MRRAATFTRPGAVVITLADVLALEVAKRARCAGAERKREENARVEARDLVRARWRCRRRCDRHLHWLEHFLEEVGRHERCDRCPPTATPDREQITMFGAMQHTVCYEVSYELTGLSGSQ